MGYELDGFETGARGCGSLHVIAVPRDYEVDVRRRSRRPDAGNSALDERRKASTAAASVEFVAQRNIEARHRLSRRRKARGASR